MNEDKLQDWFMIWAMVITLLLTIVAVCVIIKGFIFMEII